MQYEVLLLNPCAIFTFFAGQKKRICAVNFNNNLILLAAENTSVMKHFIAVYVELKEEKSITMRVLHQNQAQVYNREVLLK